jgi:hypothetical protein
MRWGGGSASQIGLCKQCLHHRVTGNRRGSFFHLCGLAKEDSRFRKYPLLPVLKCEGYEHGGEDPWDEFRTEEEKG